MKKVILLIFVGVMLVAAANSIAIRKLTVKNHAGEPVYLELQGLSYDFKDKEYDSPAWGQYHYLTTEPPSYLDQQGNVVYLEEESIKLFTLLRDKYTVNIIYNSEIVWSEDAEGLGATIPPRICESNVVADPDDYSSLDAILNMDTNVTLTIKPCDQVPANRGDLENRVYKWFRPWFLPLKK